MSARRPCAACGGTGERDVALCYCGGLADTCDGCPDCMGVGCHRPREREGTHDCPACSGRGWQSDSMPVADALADAETLRIVGGSPYDLIGVWPPSFDAPSLATRAIYDASAAFRLIHGLRG